MVFIQKMKANISEKRYLLVRRLLNLNSTAGGSPIRLSCCSAATSTYFSILFQLESDSVLSSSTLHCGQVFQERVHVGPNHRIIEFCPQCNRTKLKARKSPPVFQQQSTAAGTAVLGYRYRTEFKTG